MSKISDSYYKFAQDMIQAHVYCKQTDLVEFILDHNPGTREDFFCQYYKFEAFIENIIFEWYACSDWLAEKFELINRPVLICDYGKWIGRTTTGQAFYLDECWIELYDYLIEQEQFKFLKEKYEINL